MRIWRRNPQREEPIVRNDRTDAHILEIVQMNNRLTSEAIGELAGLSRPHVTTEEAPLGRHHRGRCLDRFAEGGRKTH